MQDLQSDKTQADLQHREVNVIFARYFFVQRSNWSISKEKTVVSESRPLGGTTMTATAPLNLIFSYKYLEDIYTHTHSCIKAVITPLNNWSLVKLRCSKVSQQSLSQFRVDGWRGKSELLMRVAHLAPAPQHKCTHPIKTAHSFLLETTGCWWRLFDEGSDTMRGRGCPETAWSPLILTVRAPSFHWNICSVLVRSLLFLF